jgi:anthranilate phosphoribosyltransferase
MKNLEYLFSEQATDIERMDFLLKMNERGITSDDVAKLVEYLLPKDFPKMPGAIDICGTGGSKLPRINTSTISAFILAQKGIKIAKHGNRASSGRFGSFDLLEALGFDIEKNADQLKNDFDKQNLAFIFAPKFFSALRHFANVRKEIGVPTIFNILGPLLNPAQPQIQIIGTNSEKNAKLLIESCRKMKKKKVAIVTSKGG